MNLICYSWENSPNIETLYNCDFRREIVSTTAQKLFLRMCIFFGTFGHEDIDNTFVCTHLKKPKQSSSTASGGVIALWPILKSGTIC